MKLKKTYRKAFFLYVIAVALFACEKNKKSDIGLNRAISEKKEYQPTWESLGNYEVPEWYKDAKLGIFIHWGPYAVPAHDSEWYPRRMYRETSGVFDYHKENWGSQEEFGYKDFIPMFRAENFDATEWAELFKNSGARYVVPVAEHHDGFAMYNSSHTKWNSQNMGPKRDVLGELARAVKEKGMHFGASSHYAWNWSYYNYDGSFDNSNPEFEGLYGKMHAPNTKVSKEFIETWYQRVGDIIDNYEPDLLWFDFGFNEPEFEEHRKKLAAYYYNSGLKRGSDVVLNYKYDAFPTGTAVLDVERGRLSRIRKQVWQTDNSISYKSWGFIEGDEFKPVDGLIDELVDIVSKNGVLLLNIGPRADGSIPEEAKERLLEIGKWLEVNGKAIYGTRPWVKYGEGPTASKSGAHSDSRIAGLNSRDIRFTSKDGKLYAVMMEWPEDGLGRIVSLGNNVSKGLVVKEVKLLGHDGALKWSQDDHALNIEMPSARPCKYAYAFEISLEGAGIGHVELTRVSGEEVDVEVTLINQAGAIWEEELALKVNGELATSRPVQVPAKTVAKVNFKYIQTKPSNYTFSIGYKDVESAAVSMYLPGIDLKGDWQFKTGDDMSYLETDFDDSSWDTVQLPSTWEEHSGYTKEEAWGWYRKKIVVPKDWDGFSIELPVGAIDDNNAVYFNGKLIGQSGGFPPDYENHWYIPFHYDVSPGLINYGGENTIAIRVYDREGKGGVFNGLGLVRVLK